MAAHSPSRFKTHERITYVGTVAKVEYLPSLPDVQGRAKSPIRSDRANTSLELAGASMEKPSVHTRVIHRSLVGYGSAEGTGPRAGGPHSPESRLRPLLSASPASVDHNTSASHPQLVNTTGSTLIRGTSVRGGAVGPSVPSQTNPKGSTIGGLSIAVPVPVKVCELAFFANHMHFRYIRFVMDSSRFPTSVAVGKPIIMMRVGPYVYVAWFGCLVNLVLSHMSCFV